MRILIVNDDGPRSEALHALVNALKEEHELMVVVPREEHSGAAHSVTFFAPLIAEKIRLENLPCPVWMINGTPADCTIWGHDRYMNKGKEPDLVISGINRGYNTADSIYCSGTVGAAIEGYLHGISSIAVSSAYENNDYEATAKLFLHLLPHLISLNRGRCFLYNINIPALPGAAIKGIRKATISRSWQVPRLEKRTNPVGQTYYWQTSFPSYSETYEDGSDRWAVENGYVAVTPLRLDILDHEVYDQLPDLNHLLSTE